MNHNILIFDIARAAVTSILNAASIHPKPGLTTPLEPSALDGVDFPCLLEGAMGLFPCLVNCASIGVETEELDPSDVMTLLQAVGQQGTRDALQATRGRAALKGHILCLGLLCVSAGRLAAQDRNLTPMALALTASSFARGLVERELKGMGKGRGEMTTGERAYALYGMEGCRGEAERGFPLTLRAAGALRNLKDTHGHLPLRERAAHVLLQIMAENVDTSLAAREGIDGLLQVQKEAKKALDEGGMLSPAGCESAARLDEDLRRRGLSPRGSAVILASALCLHALGELPAREEGRG